MILIKLLDIKVENKKRFEWTFYDFMMNKSYIYWYEEPF